MEKEVVKMAWNEPGDSKDNDPWGGGKNNPQGPPDLDEVVRKIQQKIAGIFGGARRKGPGGGLTKGAGKLGISAIVVIVLFLWAITGFYIVDEGQRGVVLQFGRFKDTTQAGLRWRIPFPVETVKIVNVSQIRNVEIGYRSGSGGEQASKSMPREALMLTQDENIIDIKFAIQYRVKDAKDYLFNVRDPDETLRQATESAVREIIGKSTMDFVLTEGRSEIAQRAEKLIQDVLDLYNSGLLITSVNMQDAQPPEQVQAAFSDAVKAREDEQRSINEAQAYANDVIPRARGARARMIEEAKAYKGQVIAKAEGEASRFVKVLAEYNKAPEVTRERLYIDAIEEVMNNSSKVMLDVDGGGNIMFLPLDRLLQGATSMSFPAGASQAAAQSAISPSSTQQQGSDLTDVQEVDQRARMSIRTREAR